MKKLTLLFVLIVSIPLLHAQEDIKPHTFILGGSVNFATQTNSYPFSIVDINTGIGGILFNRSDDSKATSLSLNPFIGKEISDNLLVGLELDYRTVNFTADVVLEFPQPESYDFKRESNQFGIGLFARYSFAPRGRFDFFMQPFAQYNTLTEEEYVDGDLDQEEKVNFIAIGSDIGVLYNINDRWQASARIGGLQYVNGSWEVVDPEDGNNFSSLGLNLSLSTIRFGVELRL